MRRCWIVCFRASASASDPLLPVGVRIGVSAPRNAPMASEPENASDPQVAPPLEQLTASQRALLRIACWVAWADGDLAEEERALLERLVFRLLPAEVGVMQAEDAFHALVAEPPQTADLDALVAALSSSDERQLAVKLAVQMLAVNQRPGDDAPVNPAEKQAYRRLLEALQLPEAVVAEAEWAARRELEQKRSLLEVIGMALAGWGAWPALDADGGAIPPGYWL